MTINHDPDSVVGFHNDGSPVHSTLAITFQEIEYVINEAAVDSAYNQQALKATSEVQSLKTEESSGGDATTYSSDY